MVVRRHDHPRRLLLRAAGDRLQQAIESACRALEGQLVRGLFLPRRAAGRAADHALRSDPGGDPAGLPELQGVHGGRAAARIPSGTRTGSTSGGSSSRWRRSPRTAASWPCTPRTTTSCSSCTRSSARRSRPEGWLLPLVHNKLSEQLAFRRTIQLAAAHGRRRLLRAHLGREGVDAVAEARAGGSPIYAETLHHYACFTAEDYKTPRGLLLSHLSVAQVSRGPGRALGRPRARRRLDDGDRRVPDLARAEAARARPRERDGRQPRRRGSHGHRVHRGRGQAGDVAPAVRRRHVHQCREDPRPLSEEGRHRARAATPTSRSSIPAIKKTLAREDFHVSDYSPWEGWGVQGWPVTTILRGSVVVENGRLLGSTRDGKLVARKISPEVLRRPPAEGPRRIARS